MKPQPTCDNASASKHYQSRATRVSYPLHTLLLLPLLVIHLCGRHRGVRQRRPGDGAVGPPEVEEKGRHEAGGADGTLGAEVLRLSRQPWARELEGRELPEVLLHPCMHLARGRRRQEASCT